MLATDAIRNDAAARQPAPQFPGPVPESPGSAQSQTMAGQVIPQTEAPQPGAAFPQAAAYPELPRTPPLLEMPDRRVKLLSAAFGVGLGVVSSLLAFVVSPRGSMVSHIYS